MRAFRLLRRFGLLRTPINGIPQWREARPWPGPWIVWRHDVGGRSSDVPRYLWVASLEPYGYAYRHPSRIVAIARAYWGAVRGA